MNYFVTLIAQADTNLIVGGHSNCISIYDIEETGLKWLKEIALDEWPFSMEINGTTLYILLMNNSIVQVEL